MLSPTTFNAIFITTYQEMDIDMNSVDSLLKTYPSLKRIPDKDRVKCSWTQHEMPARVDAIEKYVQGKKISTIIKEKIG